MMKSTQIADVMGADFGCRGNNLREAVCSYMAHTWKRRAKSWERQDYVYDCEALCFTAQREVGRRAVETDRRVCAGMVHGAGYVGLDGSMPTEH